MGFLDNSGDIILDAVLTDTGRKRLAQGNGSFRIAKFALGDDEINYGLYNKNHSSGSAYFDLEILQTPVLEAFTNNASSLKSKLISISRTNYLYLPVLKAHSLGNSSTHSSGIHVVACDQTSIDNLFGVANGVINGLNPNDVATVKVDQGIDNTAIAIANGLPDELTETQFIIEMDNRLGSLTTTEGTQKPYSYVDDDNIASYYLTRDTDTFFIRDIGSDINTASSIAGARGTTLRFGIKCSIELTTSQFLFNEIGLSNNLDSTLAASGSLYRAIDSNIRVIGATTGYSIDIPIRFVRSA